MPDTLPAFPPLEYGLRLSLDAGIRTQRLGDNYSAHFIQGTNNLRHMYELGWRTITTAQHKLLRDFLIVDLGTAYFLWQPPDEDAPLKWRVVKDSFDSVHSKFGVWDLSVRVYEVFDTA